MGTTPRVVLDTNVCLDLFVFDDPRVAPLRAALRAGNVVAVTDAACREEWQRVLEYPALGLDAARREVASMAFDAVVQLWSQCNGTGESACSTVGTISAPGRDPTAAASPRLPRCADPDDQKFLQLAHACGARWLLSRDDALLALARRCERDGLFAILAPQAWSADVLITPC
ncbi:PIN domain-containing protein [Aerolutibacter ruishenii]|uniref:Putative nucleic acid-binding protein n=1 Tax=Aerolutibacter ruishenii TaxID=686800 RepID=A0A562LPF3_9GAMM|nr:PIN domain-containing protein [Lysobacter ruishenii]TWI09511.1 putative nucleic acid-binding protein [Lysobacter ruishenii]